MATYVKSGRHRKMLETLSDDAFFLRYGFTRVPQLVQWMVTLKCPLKCPHCLAATNEIPEDMTLTEATGFVEEIAEMGVKELLLTGGEPLARPDLPEIIDILRLNKIHWSLNTAISPSSEIKRAIEKWPPGFVAVSLDGPPEIHNEFRGYKEAFSNALESISYFSQIAPNNIAAGTTVTARNFPYLGETFGIVIESGASLWGLHLVIPEGRAASRKDLFLSRSELKRLLQFASAKRNHFPVTIADEIGYCGHWEPLLRDAPFFCGAGKAQCVILPDGEVVPCTTLDKSASAGNIRHQSLREIWENGFSELRQYTVKDKCAECDYAIACKGGCWLQRKHGTECFKDVWHIPQAVTSAGMAICIGLVATGCSETPKPVNSQLKEEPINTQQAEKLINAQPKTQQIITTQEHKSFIEEKNRKMANTPGKGPIVNIPQKDLPSNTQVKPTSINPLENKEVTPVFNEEEKHKMLLQKLIIQWYASEMRSPYAAGLRERDIPTEEQVKQSAQTNIPDDPAAKYFLSFISKDKSRDIVTISKQIEDALKTDQRSLSLISLAWRDIVEYCLDGKHPAERTDIEQETFRNLLTLLDKTADNWRKEIFKNKLDPFLRNPTPGNYLFGTKSGRPRPFGLQSTVAEKHGWLRGRYYNEQVTEKFLEEHSYAEFMNISFVADVNSQLQKFSKGKWVDTDNKISVFNLLIAHQQKENQQLKLSFNYSNNPRRVLSFEVILPADIELSYGDILRLLYEQNKATIDKIVLNSGGDSSPIILNGLYERRNKLEHEKQDVRMIKWWISNFYLF